ncbi:pyrophosphate--fructose-6-phosphate 1-phosphotransferase, beta subunit [Cyanidioschyzon merolae strain 10D]|jgi:pyrophosphate--fructose-6-phosphate 1-phosphotransferase|uniref:Pyrophosphate--fructose 6-phosphate 1-phosphotransferase n=1 Tax=Cyanidioschyzon merolae (strain NIES-3377 / 10D) TaxID=280699 RepID=M1V4Y2_CYAM1|nr:pyrophosphate--fructose-6-phosphate 1-phosphotransferase, beta subunit [Cyanidioschyzon merolae strain 10D]BAM79750.1 pyrophosphate--fructose-6-phosphate 1-phosphotransferase, beta subunit [Cyanidioschyzon merolae strain 10D]|eukprot:XP_005536036.1 pyrophosphate--fructose-6-phosphate 1-phosphotransferase, beta subunit [Cyanidioschyzon merolae strain 10D]
MPLTLAKLPYEQDPEAIELSRKRLGIRVEKHTPLALQRHLYRPRCPPVLRGAFTVRRASSPQSAMDHDERIKALFPHVHHKPIVEIAFHDGEKPMSIGRPLRLGVLFSGGPAPGGHNVLAGLHDFLASRNISSSLVGFLGGPSGLIEGKYKEITEETLFRYRNQGGFHLLGSGRTKIETPEQLDAAFTTCERLQLDGLVIVGGDDSNTNACVLAEYIAARGGTTCVVGVPKTIDGDLRNAYIEASFGFDSACKLYAEIVSNLALDAVSAQKVYHICRLMGRSASHITLEVALQTHPNLAIISEEVAAHKQTLGMIVDTIADLVCERAALAKNYGVIILPEGLVEFMPDIKSLIQELNEVLAQAPARNGVAAGDAPQNPSEEADEANALGDPDASLVVIRRIAQRLSKESAELLSSLPSAFAVQLCMDRDPHGNVQVSKIESERLVAEMVERELEKRKQEGTYRGKFSAVTHFLGYEGRCGLPSNFDCNYCYVLGLVAGGLVENGCNGYIARATGLTQAPELWHVGGVPLTAMMTIERRKGRDIPVISKSVVDMAGPIFQNFKRERHSWALSDDYRIVGPMQFYGDGADCLTISMQIGD